MEWIELNLVVDSSQLRSHLVERHKLLLITIYVALVDLISENNKSLLSRELDDLLDGVSGHDLSGRVTRVDHDDDLGLQSMSEGDLVLLFEVLDSDGPALLLVQVVVDLLTSVESDRSSVKRILGDGNHNSFSKVLEKHLECHVDSLTGSIQKEYVIDIRTSRQAISLLDEIGNRLSSKAES